MKKNMLHSQKFVLSWFPQAGLGMSWNQFLSLSIIVRVDNVGALYLANNAVLGPRMKHIDIRYHFVWALIEEKIVEISFVESEEKDSANFHQKFG